MNIGRGVAGYKVSCMNQVRCADRLPSKTQVGNGNTAGLFGVIREICLGILVCMITDYLNRILISTHCSVRSQTPKACLISSIISYVDSFTQRQRKETDIVNNADSKVCLGFRQFQIIKYGNNL